MKLRKDTTFDRAMLSQEWRQLVEPEPDETIIRRVVISIPFGTEIYISLKQDADKLFGANRTYKGPVARPGEDMEFHIRANQVIWGATSQGMQSVAILVEYRSD